MGNWKVYLLFNTETKRSYIGATTDVDRRLRQHKREIKGGAKSTFKFYQHWTLVCFLNGFKDRSEAMRWEKLLKLRSRGVKERLYNFELVAKGICPEGKKSYEVPSDITLEKTTKV